MGYDCTVCFEFWDRDCNVCLLDFGSLCIIYQALLLRQRIFLMWALNIPMVSVVWHDHWNERLELYIMLSFGVTGAYTIWFQLFEI